MKIHRYMNYKVRCNACGEEDRVSTEMWKGNQARRMAMVNDIFYTRGWREYDETLFCPECAGKYLLGQDDTPANVGSGYYELKYVLATGITGRQIFDTWHSLMGYLHDDLAPFIENEEPDWAALKVTQHGELLPVEEMDYAFAELGYVTTIEFENVDMSHVTNTQGMFSGNAELEQIIVDSAWNLDNVELGECMFEYCERLKGARGVAYDPAYTGVEMATYGGYLTHTIREQAPTYPAQPPTQPETGIHPNPRPEIVQELIAKGDALYIAMPESDDAPMDPYQSRAMNEWIALKIRLNREREQAGAK